MPHLSLDNGLFAGVLPRPSDIWRSRGLTSLIRLGDYSRDLLLPDVSPATDTGSPRASTLGMARDFASTTYCQLPVQSRYLGTSGGGFTIIVWAVVDALTNFGALAACQRTTTRDGWEFRLGAAGATDSRLSLVRASSAAFRQWGGHASSNLVAAGPGLHCIAVTCANNLIETTPTFFVDGTAYTGVNVFGSSTGAVGTSTQDLWIGRRYDGVTQLDGAIPLIALFDRGLSTTEIQDLRADPSQLFEPEPIQIYWASVGGVTIIDLTAASFGFTGSAQQPSLRTELTRPSLNFSANSIQPKTTVGLAAGALNFTANAITVGGQTIIELTQAAFNFTTNAVTLIKDTAIQLTTAAFNFVANAINVSTPPIPGGTSGGGMFMALAGLFKKRRYRQQIGKNE